MFKRLFKLLLLIVFAIPCILHDVVRIIMTFLIYAPIAYVIANKSVEDIIDNFKMQGIEFFIKIIEL